MVSTQYPRSTYSYSVRDFVIAAGMVGGLLVAAGLILADLLGLSRLNLPVMLAGPITGSSGVGTWILGLFLHFVISGAIALLYGAVFRVTGHAGRRVGMVLGLGHWVIVGMLLGIALDAGFFGARFGLFTVFNLLVMHVIYGAVVGELYERAVKQDLIRPEAPDYATSPMADAQGQGRRELERYKNKRAV